MRSQKAGMNALACLSSGRRTHTAGPYLKTLAIGGVSLFMIGFQAGCPPLTCQICEGTPRWRNQLAAMLMLRGERRPTLGSCPKYSRTVTGQACQFRPGQVLILGEKNCELCGGPFLTIHDVLCHEHGASSHTVCGDEWFCLGFWSHRSQRPASEGPEVGRWSHASAGPACMKVHVEPGIRRAWHSWR